MFAARPYSQFPNSFEMQNGIPPEWIAVVREIESEDDLEDGEILFADQAALDEYHSPYLAAKEAWNQIYNQPLQNIGAFRLGMLSDAGYTRIFALNPITGLRVENAISMAENDLYWDTIKLLWNQLIDSLSEPDKPTSQEVEAWNTIAASANIRDNNGVSMVFGNDGKL